MTIIWCMVPEIWSTSDFFVILGHFLPFYCPPPPLATSKIKFWKSEKNSWRYYHFTHVYHKWQSYYVWFVRYGTQQTEIFVTVGHYLPFYLPEQPRKTKFWYKEKNAWRYYHFTHVHHKWWSYDVWFQRHEVQQNFLSL